MRGGPVIKTLDDIPWQEMTRVKYKDGRTASIWEKWIELTPRYFAYYNKWEPGAMSPHHGHHGDHTNFIVKGEIRSKDGVAKAGDHIMLEYGDLFGPWVAGPEGCELYGFMADEGSAIMGDTELWESFLEEHGAETVQVPMPKGIPPWWMEKIRNNPVVKWDDD